GIHHVEPGTYWLLDGSGKREVKRYWSWSMEQEKRHVSEEEFAALLDDAIRLQMRFDVRGCLFLSGGVDSSVIGAHLKKQWNEPEMLCFGLDCTVEGYGEFEYAKQAAEAIGVDVIPVTYDEGIVPENIQEFLYHADQPHGDFSFMLIRKLCQAAHDAGVIVAFNGDGPDEILSGFTHNQDFLTKNCGTALPIQDYFNRITYLPQDKRISLLDADFAKSLPNPVDAFRTLMGPYSHMDPIDQIASYEAGILGPGNNLIKTDRMGASLSIEGRSPFLDHRMSDLMSQMPAEQRFNGDVSKYFLKKFGLRHFEKDFMFRKKSMPTLPIGEWIKGPLKDWAHDTITDLDPARYQVANARTLLENHISGAANNTRELRTLLTASVWMAH
ncbi:MAG: asparagine synthetase B family protein, partial [Hyphomicrobiaceae bacterium]